MAPSDHWVENRLDGEELEWKPGGDVMGEMAPRRYVYVPANTQN